APRPGVGRRSRGSVCFSPKQIRRKERGSKLLLQIRTVAQNGRITVKKKRSEKLASDLLGETVHGLKGTKHSEIELMAAPNIHCGIACWRGQTTRRRMAEFWGKSRKDCGSASAGGCLGRCDLSTQRYDANLLRCLGPERATRPAGKMKPLT